MDDPLPVPLTDNLQPILLVIPEDYNTIGSVFAPYAPRKLKVLFNVAQSLKQCLILGFVS